MIFCRGSAARAARLPRRSTIRTGCADARFQRPVVRRHFRPLHGQVAAHAGKVIARSRIDEGDFTRPAQRPRREKDAVAEGRRRGCPVRQAAPRPTRSAPQLGAVLSDEGDGGWIVRRSGMIAEPGAGVGLDAVVFPGQASTRGAPVPASSAAASRPSTTNNASSRAPSGRRRSGRSSHAAGSHSSSTTCTPPPSSSEQRTAARRGPSMRSRSQ